MSTVRIRCLRPEEGLQWKPLRLAMLAESPEAFGSSLEQTVRQPDDFFVERARSVHTLILSKDGCDLGTVGAMPDLKEGERTKSYRLISLWVHPGARRQGLGQALVRAAEADILALGGRLVSLEVMPGNGPALTFYEALGYRRDRATEKTLLLYKALIPD